MRGEGWPGRDGCQLLPQILWFCVILTSSPFLFPFHFPFFNHLLLVLYFFSLVLLLLFKRKVTKITLRLRNKPYEKQLKKLNLLYLSKRMLRWYLKQVFIISCGLNNICINDYLITDLTTTTRNNGFKVNDFDRTKQKSLIEL